MPTLTRRELLTTMTAGALAATSRLALAQDAPVRKPNIIFILADDLGYGDLGCYGQKVIQTPNIDQLADEGMRFTDAYAGSTVCAPSRCALMTGLHTGHCRVRGNKRIPLLPEDTTIAEQLKDAGYATALIGKWGLGEPETTGIPNKKGFDEFFGYLNQGHAHNYYPEYLWRNTEKVTLKNKLLKYNVASEAVEYSHDLFAEAALDYVERHSKEPFFLYFALTIPHANNEKGRHDGKGMEVPSDAPYSQEDWPSEQKNHAAMITRMDKDIGRLMQKLKDLGIDEDTLIFFTSDNGPHREGGADPEFFNSNGALRGIKRDLYEGGIRVPMIARWPGKVPAKTLCPTPWAFWDFPATALDAAGIENGEPGDGISILPSLLGKHGDQELRNHLYWEFHERGFKQAVRMGRYKAVRPTTEGPTELYDLFFDVEEKRNIAKQYPEMVAQAEKLFDSERSPSADWPTPAEKQ